MAGDPFPAGCNLTQLPPAYPDFDVIAVAEICKTCVLKNQQRVLSSPYPPPIFFFLVREHVKIYQDGMFDHVIFETSDGCIQKRSWCVQCNFMQ